MLIIIIISTKLIEYIPLTLLGSGNTCTPAL